MQISYRVFCNVFLLLRKHVLFVLNFTTTTFGMRLICKCSIICRCLQYAKKTFYAEINFTYLSMVSIDLKYASTCKTWCNIRLIIKSFLTFVRKKEITIFDLSTVLLHITKWVDLRFDPGTIRSANYRSY